MKKILYFAMLWMSIMCISCNGRGNEPEIDPILLAEMNKTKTEYEACLTNNYTIGDTIFFQNDNGQMESFIVVNSFLAIAQIDNEIGEGGDGPGEIETEWETIIEAVIAHLHLKSLTTSHILKVILNAERIEIEETPEGEWVYGITTDAAMVFGSMSDSLIQGSILTYEDDSQIPADQLWIQTPTALSCKLKRNVGIISFTDNEQNTWTLVK